MGQLGRREAAASREVIAWRNVCDAFVATGIFTQAELDEPVDASGPITPVERVTEAIRDWGNARHAYAIACVMDALEEIP